MLDYPVLLLKPGKKNFIILLPPAIGYIGNKGVRLMSRRASKAGGFSLIEVLLVVFILGAICMTLINIFVYGLNLLAKTTQTNLATQVAQFEVERYRNTGFNDIPIQATGIPVTFQTLFNNHIFSPSNPYAFLFKQEGAETIPLLRNGQETIVIEDGAVIHMDKNIKKMAITIEWDYRSRTIAGGDPMRKNVVTFFSSDGINRR
jgi:type II secretory pathway pseudopilin PulG